MLKRKAMRLQDLPKRPYDLTHQDWRHLRSRPNRMPAQTPLDPGLHVARTKGDKAYFYWIGVILGTRVPLLQYIE
jgi:hypothetical protein